MCLKVYNRHSIEAVILLLQNYAGFFPFILKTPYISHYWRVCLKVCYRLTPRSCIICSLETLMDVLLITNSVRSLNDKEFCNLLLKIPLPFFVQISQKKIIMKMTIRSDTKQLAMIFLTSCRQWKMTSRSKVKLYYKLEICPAGNVSELLAKAFPLTVDLWLFLSPWQQHFWHNFENVIICHYRVKAISYFFGNGWPWPFGP